MVPTTKVTLTVAKDAVPYIQPAVDVLVELARSIRRQSIQHEHDMQLAYLKSEDCKLMRKVRREYHRLRKHMLHRAAIHKLVDAKLIPEWDYSSYNALLRRENNVKAVGTERTNGSIS